MIGYTIIIVIVRECIPITTSYGSIGIITRPEEAKKSRPVRRPQKRVLIGDMGVSSLKWSVVLRQAGGTFF